MEDNPKREIAHKVITICRRNGGLKTKSPTEDIVDIGYLESTGKKTKHTHTTFKNTLIHTQIHYKYTLTWRNFEIYCMMNIS